MKRDMDLIRAILLRIESDDDVSVDCEDEKLAFHLLLLTEEDFVRGIAVPEALTGPPQIQQTMSYVRLTARGHDFLDAIRDETVWRKTQEKVASVGGGVSISILVAIATEFLKQKLGFE